MNLDLKNLDRRIMYAVLLFALAIPIAYEFILPPTRLQNADKMYEVINNLDLGEKGVVFVAFDWGPNTVAENGPQTELLIEHLMRRRLRFATFSQYYLAAPLLDSVPRKIAERLMAEYPGQTWEYGKDWVNLGYRPGDSIFIQGIPKSKNLAEYFKSDANGISLSQIPLWKHVGGFGDIKLLAQITGLTNTFSTLVQFFKNEKHTPLLVHGCTSIGIPDAYIYLDSNQLNGLLEGIAGAAWYAERLKIDYNERTPDKFLVPFTALGIAHLVLLALILLGNLSIFFGTKRSRGVAG